MFPQNTIDFIRLNLDELDRIYNDVKYVWNFSHLQSLLEFDFLWPKSKLGALDETTGEPNSPLEGVWFNKYLRFKGVNARWKITGVTRNVYNSPLASCTVKLFKTADDTLVYTATSDNNGAFDVYAPSNTDTYYLVSYKTGTPDVVGTTINTLTAI